MPTGPSNHLPATSVLTNTDLLNGLADPSNDAVWHRFVTRYRTPLVAFAKRFGLNQQAGEDVAQETLITFLESYRAGKYQRDKGRLRSWLFGIAMNSVRRASRNAMRERVMDGSGESTAFVERIADDDASMSAAWETEWQQAVLRAALDQVRATAAPQTMRAFELYVLEGKPADEVAAEVGISRDSVFQAKRRLMQKVAVAVKTLSNDW